MRIFAIYSFVVNRDIVNFFDGPLLVSWLGQEVKNDMSDHSNDCLRVWNVKMKNKLLGQKRGTFPRIYRLWPVTSSDLN